MLRTLLDHGPLPRSHIARRTGLSPASVTDHCYALLASGLLTEVMARRGHKSMGRPSIPLDLNVGVGVVGGIHFAAAHTTVALVDLRGTVLAERRVLHEEGDAQTLVTRSADVLIELVRGASRGSSMPLLGVGVASGGWVDPAGGMIVEHDVLGWQRIPAAALLQSRLAVTVYVDSHVRSLIRAEQLFGGCDPRASVLGLFVGNIVDAGFALGDRIHHGARARAGAVAHRAVQGSSVRCDCGRIGCLQATVSEWRLVARARELGIVERTREPTDRPPIFALLDVLRSGDLQARSLFVGGPRPSGRRWRR